MKHTVIWLKPAENELANIWLNADDRELIRRAADEIDQQLGTDPGNVGESREAGQRILIASPLGVTFQVYEEDRIVRVADVWRFRVRT